MNKYLITPSLLGFFAWYLFDESGDARQKFLNTLAKVRTETTPAQQRGLDFEKKIQTYCEGKYFDAISSAISIPHDFDEEELEEAIEQDIIVKSVGDIVKGGLWQQPVKKEITVGNQEFLLYGRTDVIKRDTVYDIKFTSNYELGKFLDSSQHLIYLYCTGLPKFQYLISDGKDYWIEDYHNHVNIENEIKSKISDFLGYLKNDKEAKEMFETKWGTKND
jgi:hypothetical protein